MKSRWGSGLSCIGHINALISIAPLGAAGAFAGTGRSASPHLYPNVEVDWVAPGASVARQDSAVCPHMRFLLLFGVLSLVSAPALLRADETQPAVMPMRDVDISYSITRPDQPPIIERRRWLASEHLQRIDGSDGSSTIFDPIKGEFTLLNPANRTFRKFEGSPRMPRAPAEGTPLKRTGESVVTGLHCVDWSWTANSESRTACLTPDGVLLRLVVDGQMVMQARSVSYGPQRAALFDIPFNYEPALAPEGGPSD
jgi:hypothetical protein